MSDPERNNSYISMVAQLEVDWDFTVPSRSTTIAEVFDEFVEIVKTLHGCFNEFVIPTEIKYGVSVYAADSLIENHLDEPLEKPIRAYPDEGLTLSGSDPATQLRDAVQKHTTEGEVAYLHQLVLNRARVKMVIGGQDQYVSRETPERYKFWSRTDEALLESEPYLDPLSISVRHTTFGSEETDYDSVYRIGIGTMVDTWFQQTEIGERNRERLGVLLRRVADSFDVIETDYESNMYALPNYPELQVD